VGMDGMRLCWMKLYLSGDFDLSGRHYSTSLRVHDLTFWRHLSIIIWYWLLTSLLPLDKKWPPLREPRARAQQKGPHRRRTPRPKPPRRPRLRALTPPRPARFARRFPSIVPRPSVSLATPVTPGNPLPMPLAWTNSGLSSTPSTPNLR